MVIGLVFELLGTDAQLTRRKLGKKNTPRPWRPPASHGRYGDSTLAPSHSTIIEHDMRQVYVVKTREYNCFYYLLAIQRRCASSTRRERTNAKVSHSRCPNEPSTTTPAARDRRSYPLEMEGDARGDGWRRLRRQPVGGRHWLGMAHGASSTRPRAA